MATKDFKRKLTAILSADVAGYSRLMGEDEAATVEAIITYREVMGGLIRQHRGRVVDSPGDNLLAEFASVVDAVQCAVSVQKEFQSRNAELPENRRMDFRIGINLGDVIEEEDRIYGDGVNIAARLEALAEPGGICVSKTAFDHIETKLPLGYEYLGEQEVKNISKPVAAYRVLMESRVTVAEKIEKKKGMPEKTAFPLPEKPSIAVLPFTNMSGDPGQEYFSDGMTEQIIMGISKIPKLFVIARSSSFKYKGSQPDIREVGSELGVRYVLEGSVQKTDNRLRITAQLIDAIKGHHLWSERYDRELKDIFALQDDITINIMTAMQVKLTLGEQRRTLEKGTENFEAYIKYIEAYEIFYKFTEQDNILSRRLIKEAIVLDPGFGLAYSVLGWTYVVETAYGWSESREQCLSQAMELGKKALALDDSLDCAHGLLAFCYRLKREYEKAIAEASRAVELAPNAERALNYFGEALVFAGRSEEAIPVYERAVRISPFPLNTTLLRFGVAYLFTGRYEKAISMCEKAVDASPGWLLAPMFLTAAYAAAGREKEARAEAEKVLRLNPNFTVDFVKTLNYGKEVDTELVINSLRKAGLK